MNWKKITLILIGLALVVFACTNDLTQKNQFKKQAPFSTKEEESSDKQLEFLEKFKDPQTGKLPENIRVKELNFAKNLPTKQIKSAEEQWFLRGPYNLGGRTRAMGLDIENENNILAGGVTGGLFKSTNGGESFYRVTPPDQLHSVSCIAQHNQAEYSNVWYYGTGEGGYGVISHASYSNQTGGNGIYKSTDNGETWELLTSTTTNTPQTYSDGTFDIVYNVVTSPIGNPFQVWAAVSKGIMYSEDGGFTWQEVLGFNGNNSEYTMIKVADNGIMYAALSSGSASGIYRSTNGIDWIEINPDVWFGAARKSSIAINPCNHNQLYVLNNYNTNDAHKLYRLDYEEVNEQANWTDLSENIPFYDCQWWIDVIDYDIGSFKSQSSFCMDIAVNPNDCDMVILAGTNIYRSYNGFTTADNDWIGGYKCEPENYLDTRYPNHHPDQHLILFHPNQPDVMYNANDGGLYKTSNILADSIEWVQLNNGYVTGQFYTIAIEEGETENPTIIGGTQDNGTWLNNSTYENQPFNWVSGGDGSFCAIPQGMENIYTSYQRGRVFKVQLNENGETVNFARIDPIEATEASYLFIAPLALDVADNNVMYLPNGRNLYRCNDLSQFEINGNIEAVETGWEKIDNASFPTGFGTNRISCLAQSIDNPDFLYYGTANGKAFRLENMQGIADNVTLNNISGPFSNRWVSSISVNQQNANELILTTSNYNSLSIFYSDDAGGNWTEIGGNLEPSENGSGDGPSIIASVIHNSPQGTIYYVGTSIGLFSTTEINGTETVWQLEGIESLGFSVINMIKTRAFDNKVFVATHGSGIFQSGEADVQEPPIGVDNINVLPLKTYPNPCRDILNIELPELQNGATLFLYNISGKLVYESKLTANQSQSSISLTSEISKLSSGNYVLSLQTNNKQYSAKIKKW